MDTVGPSIGVARTISTTNRAMDIAKLSLLPSQTSSSGKNYPIGTSTGNVVMLADNTRNSRNASMLVPISAQNPITILPLTNKMKTSQKSMKTVPKITVNSCSLQRTHKAKPQSPIKKKLANELDDDLGNILDIPIIFAKDGENLNAIEKVPVSSLAQMPVGIDTFDRSVSKLGPTTKVVLISNKHDKMQQPMKMASQPMQTIVRPAGSVQTMNRTVPQGRSHNPSIPTINRAGIPIQNMPRTSQPTIKYTKIILAKRNSILGTNHDDKADQVILTKNIQKPPPSKILSYDKNEHRYAQMFPRAHPKCHESIPDDTLEIEDAIKTNIIERKMQTIPEIDLTSPTKGSGIGESPRTMNYDVQSVYTNDDFDNPDVMDICDGTELHE